MFRNLEAEFKRAGMTAGDVAKSIGMNVSTLSQKMNGHRPFTVNQAVAIQKALATDKTIDELFEITEG